MFRILIILIISFNITYSQDYYLYVAAESDDTVSLLKFDGNNLSETERIVVGSYPTENEGPHGLTIDPNGKYWYLTLAHGNPFGKLIKYSTETNEIVDETTLGLFPASMQISTVTGFLYCVNFNLHGDMKPSSVSVVDPETMTDVYNDIYLKRYTTALIKRQWGANLSKFNGVAMLGGVTLNGQQIFSEAQEDIRKLEEEIRGTYETPVTYMIG